MKKKKLLLYAKKKDQSEPNVKQKKTDLKGQNGGWVHQEAVAKIELEVQKICWEQEWAGKAFRPDIQ